LATELRKDGISIKDAAKILGVPRSRFYFRNRKSNQTPKSKQNYVSDIELAAVIRMVCNRYPLYGYRRIRVILKREFNINVSQKRVNRVMNKLGLSQHRLKNRRIVQMKERPGQPAKPNQIWKMDMTKTYLNGYGWLFIMAIIDRYDRSIVGYEINSRARAAEWLAAFDKAVKNHFPEGTRDQGLILQVDNGCQTASRKFIKEMTTCDVTLLYSSYATPEHNAHIVTPFPYTQGRGNILQPVRDIQ
jgi:putative transposase